MPNNARPHNVIKNILITGNYGVGKTTLIRNIISKLNVSTGGFYTAEVRGENGRRCGFKIVTMDGEEGMLASVEIVGNFKVSRYGVDVSAMGRVAVPAVKDALARNKVIMIDEIGRMELASKPFRNVVEQALNSSKPVLGTVGIKSKNFMKKAKERTDTQIIRLTSANFHEIETHVGRLLNRIGFGQ